MNYIKTIKITACFILSFSFLTAEIKEINDITNVKQYAKDNSTLVLFDLDNTVLKSKSPWGRDECFSASLNYLQNKHNISISDAVQIVLPSYRMAVYNEGINLVEKKVTNVINNLKENGKHVIALTARSTYKLVDTTQKQLNNHGIQFSFYNKQINNFANTTKLENALFAFGIMSCANNNKGTCLKHLLQYLKIKPTKIVFIDDKRKYLEQVEETLNSLGIEFLGLRYGFCDKEVASFTLTDTDKELLDQEYAKFDETKAANLEPAYS